MPGPLPYSSLWPGEAGRASVLEEICYSNPLTDVLPADVVVNGTLRLRGMKRLTEIPDGVFQGHSLSVTGAPMLRKLPAVPGPLKLLLLDGAGLEFLPHDLPFADGGTLVVQNCNSLKNLPAGVASGKLDRIVIRNCPQLTELPELSARSSILISRWRGTGLPAGLSATSLCIKTLPSLVSWTGRLQAKNIVIRNCLALRELAVPLSTLVRLEIADCPVLERLPEGMGFEGKPAELLLRNCPALTQLPALLKAARHPAGSQPALIVEMPDCRPGPVPDYPFPWKVRIRRVLLDPASALDPDRIDPLMILSHPNAEVRRILLENMGMDTLLSRTQHALIDEDRDAGGIRRLIHFEIPRPDKSRTAAGRRPPTQARGGGLIMKLLDLLMGHPSGGRLSGPLPMRFLECRCPSTGRLYLVPVPPVIPTCHAAAAWMAGFDNPADYAPISET